MDSSCAYIGILLFILKFSCLLFIAHRYSDSWHLSSESIPLHFYLQYLIGEPDNPKALIGWKQAESNGLPLGEYFWDVWKQSNYSLPVDKTM
jgi:hypothetical protein